MLLAKHDGQMGLIASVRVGGQRIPLPKKGR